MTTAPIRRCKIRAIPEAQSEGIVRCSEDCMRCADILGSGKMMIEGVII
jgi:hypothetical protein